MPYRIDMNLQQTAALHAAISFWNQPHVKDKIIEFFNVHEKHDDKEATTHWNQLTKEVLNTWEYGILPRRLEGDLIHVAKEIGRKIFDWSRYIKMKDISQLKVEPETLWETNMYVSCICWTPHGTIDEVATYEKVLLKNPNFSVFKLYVIACEHAVEDKINYLWRTIPRSMRRKLDDIMDDERFSYDERYILAYWRYRRDGNFSRLWDGYFDNDISVEENMVFKSIHKGNHNALKYFWRKLSAEKKNNMLIRCLHFTLERYTNNSCHESIANYRQEKWIEIFLFLMPQISAEKKEEFYNTTLEVELFENYQETDVNHVILWLFPYAWPWQDLLIPVLNDIFRRQKLSDEMVYNLLNEITRQMVKNHKLGYVVSNSKLQGLLQEVWWNIPRDVKQTFIIQEFVKYYYNDVERDFIFDLLDVRDLDSLDMILNDPGIESVRDKYIECGEEIYDEIIINDQYEFIDQFIETIFTSNEDKINFRQSINLLEYFIKREEFNLANKFLDWQCWRPMENQYTKMLLKKSCKEDFSNKFPPENWICEIWNDCLSNVDEAVERSSQFLNWLFESGDQIRRFKRDKLANADIKRTLGNHSLPTDVIERFFNWCGLFEEEVQQIMSVN